MTRRHIHLVFLWALISPGTTALADSQLEALAAETLITEAGIVLQDPVAGRISEKKLEQIVLTLGSRPETPAARLLIETLSTREPQVLVAHEEGGAMIPFVDVGAAARFSLRNWARLAAQQEALLATRSGDSGFLQSYFDADATRQTGMLDTIRLADPKDLVLYRDELMNRIHDAGGDRLAAAFAATLADTALFERVIAEGSATVALEAIEKLEASIGADAALQLMRLAIKRQDIASATLYEIGKLTPTLPAAETVLWEALTDPGLGGSAAAVLARNANGTTISRLIGLLNDSDKGLVQKRALLALRLSGDSRASQFVEQWQGRQTGADR